MVHSDSTPALARQSHLNFKPLELVSFKRKEVIGVRSNKFLERLNNFTDPSGKTKANTDGQDIHYLRGSVAQA
jgi:hypothetical protein